MDFKEQIALLISNVTDLDKDEILTKLNCIFFETCR